MISDWLLENPEALETVVRAREGRLVLLVKSPDLEFEINRASGDKPHRLAATLGNARVADVPTHLPRLGQTFVLGKACLAGPDEIEMERLILALSGVENLDGSHVVNAVRANCDVFLTLDEDLLETPQQNPRNYPIVLAF